MKKLILATVAALAASQAPALQVGTPQTFANVSWSASFNVLPFNMCNNLRFDATGDLAISQSMVIYGALNCPSLGGGFGMTGSMYVSVDGSLNITMSIAGMTVVCPRIVGWLGQCNVFDASNIQRGTGTISLL